MTGLIPLGRRNLSAAGAGFDDLYSVFDNLVVDRWPQSRNAGKDIFRVDIMEADKDYKIEAELPGVKKEEVDISVANKTLTISVNREEKIDDENEGYIHLERRQSSMSRSIKLAGANLDDISAKLENGVLTMAVPKYDKTADTRKIEIE